jgi:hypothetical protein
MKKLLIAAGVAGGLAAGAVPAFAQSAMTSQPGWAANADNGVAGSTQAPYNEAFDYYQSPNYQAGISNDAGSDYLMQQQDLRYMPGYSVGNG